MSPHVAATTPYPWPYDGDLDGPATALLVVLAPPGSGTLEPAAVCTVHGLAREVRRRGGVVLLARTRHPRRGSRPALPAAPDADGALGGLAVDLTIEAGGLDAFYGSDLDLLLRRRGVRRLILAGTGLETAVHSTMRDANDRGYECLLVVDACAPVDPSLVPAAVSTVEMSGGIFGAVGTAAHVLDALATPAPSAEGAPR